MGQTNWTVFNRNLAVDGGGLEAAGSVPWRRENARSGWVEGSPFSAWSLGALESVPRGDKAS